MNKDVIFDLITVGLCIGGAILVDSTFWMLFFIIVMIPAVWDFNSRMEDY